VLSSTEIDTESSQPEPVARLYENHSKTNDGQVPAYVGILEVPEENWRMHGQQAHLAPMQIKA
jgi:hypothetical protein